MDRPPNRAGCSSKVRDKKIQESKMRHEERKRIAVFLGPESIKSVRKAAIDAGKSASAFIAEIIEKYMEGKK